MAAPFARDAGFALTIAGCPYGFTSAQHGAITSLDGEWPAGITIARDALNVGASRLEWLEESDPVRTALRVTAPTFVLDNLRLEAGPYAGRDLGDWLFTRDRRQVPRSPLASGMTDVATSLVVANGSVFSAGTDFVVWVGQEAILVGSRAGNTLNVSQRGYWGTRAVAHSAGDNVFAEFPYLTRKRALFWLVDAANVAVARWRGFCNRSPRTAGREQATFEVQADHTWEFHSKLRLGAAEPRCRLRGFARRSLYADVAVPGSGWTSTSGAVTDRVDASLSAALGRLQHDLGEGLRANSITTVSVSIRATDRGIAFGAQSTTYATLAMRLVVGDRNARGQSVDGSDPRSASGTLEGVPSALVPVTAGRSGVFPVTRVDELPATWTPTTTTTAGIVTTVRTVLRGEASPEFWLVLTPSAVTATDPDVGGSTVTAVPNLIPRHPAAETPPAAIATIERAVPLAVTRRVTSGHWVYALQYGVVTLGLDGTDPRDWDFALADRIAGATASHAAPVDWYLDGSVVLGPLVVNVCRLNGIALGVRAGGKLAPVYLGPIADTEPVAAAVTTADYREGDEATWGAWPDALANEAVAKADAVELTIRDEQSRRDYGPAATVELDLDGVVDPRRFAESTADAATYILANGLGIWVHPVPLVTLPLDASWDTRLFHGDVVTITDTNLPNGLGGRGLAAARGRVVSKRMNYNRFGVDVGVALVPRATGYSPCARVASIAGAVLTLAAPGYAAGSDFAGSDRAGYGGTANDGGTSTFRVGDRVQLIYRDSTTRSTYSAIVTGVNPATREITLSAVVPNVSPKWVTDAPTGVVDVRYDVYGTAGLQATQKQYAWVGGEASGVIGASSDPPHEWSP
jgi:hypothetical protein